MGALGNAVISVISREIGDSVTKVSYMDTPYLHNWSPIKTLDINIWWASLVGNTLGMLYCIAVEKIKQCPYDSTERGQLEVCAWSPWTLLCVPFAFADSNLYTSTIIPQV